MLLRWRNLPSCCAEHWRFCREQPKGAQQRSRALIDKAIIWHGAATYASNLIKYDSKRSIVKVGEKTSDAKHIHVLL